MKYKTYLIVDNIRSAHNVGSILRTCEGLGVDEVFLCGYTPYPQTVNDNRIPYQAELISKKITKTSLGAELTQQWRHYDTTKMAIDHLRSSKVEIIALELSSKAQNLISYKPSEDVAIIIGNEVTGVEPAVLKLSDRIVQITMLGKKESFNVSAAAAMALFYMRNMV